MENYHYLIKTEHGTLIPYHNVGAIKVAQGKSSSSDISWYYVEDKRGRTYSISKETFDQIQTNFNII